MRRIVRQYVGPARRCYQDALAEAPDLEVTIDVAFQIDADGTASNVRALEGKLPSDMSDCIARALVPREFPEPTGGKPVKVVVPLTLSPKIEPVDGSAPL